MSVIYISSFCQLKDYLYYIISLSQNFNKENIYNYIILFNFKGICHSIEINLNIDVIDDYFSQLDVSEYVGIRYLYVI